MAYNPYSAINNVYKLKQQWVDADDAGDTYRKNEAAQKAQKYYSELESSGYADVAAELKASDVGRAKEITDKWATMGKTKTRDYLYDLGKGHGMSKSDVDKIIGWDNRTGNVIIGGQNIGAPDVEIDGVSYWGDTSKLDKAFKNYIDRTGTVRAPTTAVNQENEKLFGRYGEEWEDLKTTNPFTTEAAKAILAKYDLAGLQERDNQVAANAGNNGGNIDSFAAANALRQQAGLVSQGQTVVLDDHYRKLEHARQLLSDMGANIERVFSEDQTAQNNDVARKSEVANISGYTPTEWTIKNDPMLSTYLDENGHIKPEYEDWDWQSFVNKAKANGDTELARKYAIIRGIKINDNLGKYGQYAQEGDIAYMSPQKTEPARQFDEQVAAGDRAIQAGNQATIDQINANADAEVKVIGANTDAQKEVIGANTESEKEIINANTDAALKIGTTEDETVNYDALNTLISMFTPADIGPRNFILEVIKPLYESGTDVPEGVLQSLLVDNAEEYNIDVEDARKIFHAFGFYNTDWLDDFEDRTGEEQYMGMKAKGT